MHIAGQRRSPQVNPCSRAQEARRVGDLLRVEVLESLGAGELVGSESELARRYRASRNAVRDALGKLRAQRLVMRKPGTGTLVTADKAAGSMSRLLGLSEYLKDSAGRVANEVWTVEAVPAVPVLAQRLDIAAGSDVVLIERRRLVDDLPMSLDTTYVRADVGEPLGDLDLTQRDLFGLLEDSVGVTLGVAATSVEALPADDGTAVALGIDPGDPVLASDRVVADTDGVPIAVEFVRYRHDRIVLTGTTMRQEWTR